MNYLVSILVPIYGVEKYIRRCAESLFEQTYSNIEFIFVDDYTPDNSISKLKETLANYPNHKNQVKILRHEHNRGLAAARNTAVEAAAGEFLMHVDSDDWIESDTVELCMAKQLETDADIVRFGAQRIMLNKQVKRIPLIYDSAQALCEAILRKEAAVNVWGGLYRRSLYVDNGIWAKEGVNISEDYNLTPRLAYYAKTVAFVCKPLYNYDMTNMGSYIHNVSEKMMQQIDAGLDILHDFFKDKGQRYTDALETGEYLMMLERMKLTSQEEDFRKRYYDARERIAKLKPSNRKGSTTPYRLIYSLRFYPLVKLYIKVIRSIRKNPIKA